MHYCLMSLSTNIVATVRRYMFAFTIQMYALFYQNNCLKYLGHIEHSYYITPLKITTHSQKGCKELYFTLFEKML